MKKIILPILLYISTFSFAQKQEVEVYFTAVRNKQATQSFSVNKKNESQYIKAIAVYLNDTLPSVRTEAYYLISNLGRQSQQRNLRKDVVNLLIRGWRDTDSGINGMVATSLTRFEKQDFDRAAIDSIKGFLKRLPPYADRLFKLAGYLELQDQVPVIKSYLEKQPPLPDRDKWACYISLARLGDQQALDLILNRVRTFGINDDIVYEIFPDLVYTRSYRGISYLVEVLFSDDRTCEAPANGSRTKITCAYRVMELLAPALKDYPVAVGTSGDLVARDYKKALSEVREWFKQRDGKYEIIRDTF